MLKVIPLPSAAERLRSRLSSRASTATLTAALTTALAATLLTGPASADQRDARAVEIAESTMKAMGGSEAWAKTRFLRFNFFGFRTHHWDRQTGHHRLEGQTREGEAYVVLHNINTRQGKAWLNGELLEGEAAETWLERAYGAWINDVYWLVMPYKLLDPGVNLAYDGEEKLDGQVYDKLKLTFESVGLTPGDTYWAYINRDTGLMDRWAYFLQDWEEGREPTQWQWLDWATYGSIKLSSKRLNAADEREAPLGDLAVFDTLPDSVFESPAAIQ